MTYEHGHRIAALHHRIKSIRLALDATGTSDDVRELLTAMLDEAERDLGAADQVALPPLHDLPVPDLGDPRGAHGDEIPKH